MSTTIRNYGLIRSNLKSNTPKVVFTKKHVKKLRTVKPKSLDTFNVESNLPSNLISALANINQGSINSCSANACAYMLAFDEIKQNNTMIFFPSRLFIYYATRMIEGSTGQDAGAQIQDLFTALTQYGACDEHNWIYDINQVTVAPPTSAFTEAKNFSSIQYAYIDLSEDNTVTDKINHLKNVLLSGYPFIFGFEVYSSFETETVTLTGMMPIPASTDTYIGGHCVVGVGYDDTKQCMLVKNSWGSSWGINGYFYMPYNFIGNPIYAFEFWVTEKVSNPNSVPNWSASDINPSNYSLNCFCIR